MQEKGGYRPSIKLQGLPPITDYHLLNNKRFVLTRDTQNTVQLWQLDTCKCIHTFNQTWDATKKLLKDTYELSSEKVKIPQSWMNVDIKLGVSITFFTFLTELDDKHGGKLLAQGNCSVGLDQSGVHAQG